MDRRGRSYLGKHNVDAQNRPCSSWGLDDFTPDLDKLLPDEGNSVTSARNYCRLLRGFNWTTPHCLVYNDGSFIHSPCRIDYCG